MFIHMCGFLLLWKLRPVHCKQRLLLPPFFRSDSANWWQAPLHSRFCKHISPDSSKNCCSADQHQISIFIMEVGFMLAMMSLSYRSTLNATSREIQSSPGHRKHGAKHRPTAAGKREGKPSIIYIWSLWLWMGKKEMHQTILTLHAVQDVLLPYFNSCVHNWHAHACACWFFLPTKINLGLFRFKMKSSIPPLHSVLKISHLRSSFQMCSLNITCILRPYAEV